MKLPGHKELSLNNKLEEYLTPKKVYIPLPKEYDFKKNINDHVLVGDVLGYKETKFELPILSPISGTIKELDNNIITIENDFKDERVENITRDNFNNISKEEFISIIKNCGIVGMSGSGFPTYVKFNTDKEINKLLVNAIECEPYITSDYTLIKSFAKEVLESVEAILNVYKINEGIIAIKETNKEIIDILNENNSYNNIIIKTVKNYYPAGYKKNIMYDTTGIKYEGRSSDVGVIECNVHTIYAIYKALKYNTPVTERIVTFTGEALNTPKNILVKIGTNAREIVESIGTKEKEYDLIQGGAMMGEYVDSDIEPITMTTNNILVLNFTEDIPNPCLRCGKCVEACPVKLSPVLIKDSIRNKEKLEYLDPNRCIGCGLCSYVCPAKINVREYIKKAKLIVRGGK